MVVVVGLHEVIHTILQLFVLFPQLNYLFVITTISALSSLLTSDSQCFSEALSYGQELFIHLLLDFSDRILVDLLLCTHNQINRGSLLT